MVWEGGGLCVCVKGRGKRERRFGGLGDGGVWCVGG